MDTDYVLFGEVSHPPKFQVKNAFCAFLVATKLLVMVETTGVWLVTLTLGLLEVFSVFISPRYGEQKVMK